MLCSLASVHALSRSGKELSVMTRRHIVLVPAFPLSAAAPAAAFARDAGDERLLTELTTLEPFDHETAIPPPAQPST